MPPTDGVEHGMLARSAIVECSNCLRDCRTERGMLQKCREGTHELSLTPTFAAEPA